MLARGSCGLAGWAPADDVVPVDQAIDFFTQRSRANPSDIHAYTMRAIIWQSRNEHDIALADYTEAIRVDPTQAWLHDTRPSGFRASTTRPLSIAAGSASTSSPWPHNRAVAWGEKGQHEKACADYKWAGSIHVERDGLPQSRCLLWVKTKEYDKAIADYNEAIRLIPTFRSRLHLSWHRLAGQDER